ncbi:hypothetical protein LXL04_020444 [Taraxacum kok-saghyz]
MALNINIAIIPKKIANLVTLQGEEQPFVKNVLTLKSCSPIVGVDVMSFDTEREVLLAWRDFVREIDPDIIIGYNICKFDLPYLIQIVKYLHDCTKQSFYIADNMVPVEDGQCAKMVRLTKSAHFLPIKETDKLEKTDQDVSQGDSPAAWSADFDHL